MSSLPDVPTRRRLVRPRVELQIQSRPQHCSSIFRHEQQNHYHRWHKHDYGFFGFFFKKFLWFSIFSFFQYFEFICVGRETVPPLRSMTVTDDDSFERLIFKGWHFLWLMIFYYHFYYHKKQINKNYCRKNFRIFRHFYDGLGRCIIAHLDMTHITWLIS